MMTKPKKESSDNYKTFLFPKVTPVREETVYNFVEQEDGTFKREFVHYKQTVRVDFSGLLEDSD